MRQSRNNGTFYEATISAIVVSSSPRFAAEQEIVDRILEFDRTVGRFETWVMASVNGACPGAGD